MIQTKFFLAPSGALSLRQTPELWTAEAAGRALARLLSAVPYRKRRTRFMEGTMQPDHHNYLAAPAQGSAINAGQFGSIFAPHPCGGCARQPQAYDAQEPARPQRTLRQAVSALFARKMK